MDPATAHLLTTPEALALVDGLTPYDEAASLAMSSSLRAAGHSPELVAAVLTQAALRTRGRAKLGDAVDGLLLTPDGLEQATRPAIARHHANRLARCGTERVLDLGCGLGLDARAMLAAGLDVLAVDADEATAELARHNLACIARHLGRTTPEVRRALAEDVVADRESLGVHAGARGADSSDDAGLGAGHRARHTAVWTDPARRTPGVADITGRTRRTWRLDDLAPSWDLVQQLGSSAHAAGSKLSPTLAHAAVPSGCEAQWVSWRGEVLECVVWWGAAVEHPGRTALVLGGDPGDPTAHLVTEVDASHRAPAATAGADLPEWLYEPDRAVIRAGLVGALEAAVDGAELAPGVGYVASSLERDVPWARRFRVVAEMAAHDRTIRAYLRERRIGAVTLKKRGTDVDPDRLRRALRLKGSGDHAVLVLTRRGGRQVAIHVEPAAPRQA